MPDVAAAEAARAGIEAATANLASAQQEAANHSAAAARHDALAAAADARSAAIATVIAHARAFDEQLANLGATLDGAINANLPGMITEDHWFSAPAVDARNTIDLVVNAHLEHRDESKRIRAKLQGAIDGLVVAQRQLTIEAMEARREATRSHAAELQARNRAIASRTQLATASTALEAANAAPDPAAAPAPTMPI